MKIFSQNIENQLRKAFLDALLVGTKSPLYKLQNSLNKLQNDLNTADVRHMTPLEEMLAHPEPDMRSAESLLKLSNRQSSSQLIQVDMHLRNPYITKKSAAIESATDIIDRLIITKKPNNFVSTIGRIAKVSAIFAVAAYIGTSLMDNFIFDGSLKPDIYNNVVIGSAIGSAIIHQTKNALSYRWRLNRGLKIIEKGMKPK